MAREGGAARRSRLEYASICEICDDVTGDAETVAYLRTHIDQIAEEVAAAVAITEAAARQEARR
jgi:hypothetical protein